jgi:hypothetical protein
MLRFELLGMGPGGFDFATLLMMLCLELWPYWLTIVGFIMVVLVAENRDRRSDARQQSKINADGESPVGVEPDTRFKRVGEQG